MMFFSTEEVDCLNTSLELVDDESFLLLPEKLTLPDQLENILPLRQ